MYIRPFLRNKSPPVPHPRSKRESVGYYVVLFMQNRPKLYVVWAYVVC